MGQAAVALPEPTDPPTAPPQANADDLLSKLAGEEIDRMLAEVETSEPAGSPAAVSAGPTATPTDAPVAPLATAVSLQPQAAEGTGPGDAPPPPGAADVEVQNQLDALFDELSGTVPPAELPQAGSEAVGQPQPSAEVSQTPEPVKQEVDQESARPEPGAESPATAEPVFASASEIADSAVAELVAPEGTVDDAAGSSDSLDAQLVQSLGEVSTPTPAATTVEVKPVTANTEVASESHAPGGDPFYVKLLELLNAPFASMKPEMREMLGKVAIVTVFNAIVILLYVTLFRGR